MMMKLTISINNNRLDINIHCLMKESTPASKMFQHQLGLYGADNEVPQRPQT